MILDCENNTLSFERNYEFLGVAFRGIFLYKVLYYVSVLSTYMFFSWFSDLPSKKLYPTVSAVYGNTEVSMVYIGPPYDG